MKASRFMAFVAAATAPLVFAMPGAAATNKVRHDLDLPPLSASF